MEQSSLTLQKRRAPKIIGIVLGLFVVASVGVGALFFLQQPRSTVAVPQHIRDWASFPLFMPGNLPGGYRVDPETFSIQEDAVVTFTAKNESESSIYFTEQQKPSGFDFDTFYREEMTEATIVNDAPYPTVTAKMQRDKLKVVSIVTDKTWIIASTAAPLSEADLQVIARHIQLYE